MANSAHRGELDVNVSFCIIWYSVAAVMLLLSVTFSTKCRWWVRILLSSVVFALGFTSIPELVIRSVWSRGKKTPSRP